MNIVISLFPIDNVKKGQETIACCLPFVKWAGREDLTPSSIRRTLDARILQARIPSTALSKPKML
jgi:hypothetical protein